MTTLVKRLVAAVDRHDLLVVIGLALGAYGGLQVSAPATYITLGVVLVAAGVLGARR